MFREVKWYSKIKYLTSGRGGFGICSSDLPSALSTPCCSLTFLSDRDMYGEAQWISKGRWYCIQRKGKKKSRVLFTASALSFIAIDSWDRVQENVHSGTEWTSPASHNEEMCTAKLWRSQWQQWISTLSKMFLELKKEFKVRNILESDTNTDLVGWRKCSQVSSHSSAWKDRFA